MTSRQMYEVGAPRFLGRFAIQRDSRITHAGRAGRHPIQPRFFHQPTTDLLGQRAGRLGVEVQSRDLRGGLRDLSAAEQFLPETKARISSLQAEQSFSCEMTPSQGLSPVLTTVGVFVFCHAESLQVCNHFPASISIIGAPRWSSFGRAQRFPSSIRLL